MKELLTLLSIIPRRVLNTLRRPREIRWARSMFLMLVGTVLMAAVFGLLRLIIAFFYSKPIIGPILVSRMFSMAFLVFLFMLVYSNILASLSCHFLSKDLPLLHASPAPPVSIFLAKALEAVVSSSWMVVLICVPLYAAFGVVKGASATYYALVMVATVPFLLIPAGFSMLMNTGLMYMFPARRTREIMVLIGTMMFCGLVGMYRFLEPEKLFTASASNEFEVFELMKSLAVPSTPYLPSAWASNAVVAASNVDLAPGVYWSNVGWLWGAAVLVWAICLMLAHRWYVGAWQHAAESTGIKRGVRLARTWLPRRAGPYGSILLKDFKVFIREPSQWGQMLLLATLILFYLFTMASIPADAATGLGHLLFFVNLGFIGLMLTAVAARFLFPLVSLEGGTFALLKISPLSMEKYLWTRLFAGLVPLTLLALVLVGFSVPALGADRFMTLVALVSMMGMTVAVSGLAVGCGAVFAKFRISNPEEIVTSAGGFMFMALSSMYIMSILVLESGPVRLYYGSLLFRREFTGQLLTVAALTAVAALTLACVVGSIRIGARSLTRREL